MRKINDQIVYEQERLDSLLFEAEATANLTKISEVDAINGRVKQTIATRRGLEIKPQVVSEQESFSSLLSEAKTNAKLPETFEIVAEKDQVKRIVTTRDGQQIETTVPFIKPPVSTETPCSLFDYSWLRLKNTPHEITTENARGTVRLVDLFSGCGGLSLGAREACRALGLYTDHVLAADMHQSSLETYAANFLPEKTFDQLLQDRSIETRPLDEVLDGELGTAPTHSESELLQNIDQVDLLVGGPPCQGHSNLNNHTRGNDEKNELILRMARFAELTGVTHIIIENVPTVTRDKTNSLQKTHDILSKLGYSVRPIPSMNAANYGVAQKRSRYFLVASKIYDVTDIEKEIRKHTVDVRTFKWACSDLEHIKSVDIYDTPPDIDQVNQDRISYLFKNEAYDLVDSERPDCHKNQKHTYPSVYGRLWPDKPSPTITRGFGGMGQGRYVHPTQERLITPHEAARLQFFPDFFRFKAEHRTSFQHMIGNAVPPKLGYLLALHLLR